MVDNARPSMLVFRASNGKRDWKVLIAFGIYAREIAIIYYWACKSWAKLYNRKRIDVEFLTHLRIQVQIWECREFRVPTQKCLLIHEWPPKSDFRVGKPGDHQPCVKNSTCFSFVKCYMMFSRSGSTDKEFPSSCIYLHLFIIIQLKWDLRHNHGNWHSEKHGCYC